MQHSLPFYTRVQPFGTNADYAFNPATPFRNDTILNNQLHPPAVRRSAVSCFSAPHVFFFALLRQPYFSTFKLGVGGPCASRFTPQASYWCSNTSEGGGPGACLGWRQTHCAHSHRRPAPSRRPLPGTRRHDGLERRQLAPAHALRGRRVPLGRPLVARRPLVLLGLCGCGRAGGAKAVWCRIESIRPAAVTGAAFSVSNNQTTFNFSTTVGGNQGSRGGNAGDERRFSGSGRARCPQPPLPLQARSS